MEHPVTLSEMLAAREKRAFRQRQLLDKYKSTLICFTMNIAGPVKNSPLIQSGFALGKRLLEERLAAQNISLLHQEESCTATGCEAFYVLAQDPLTVKELTSDIEEGSELGRLFDMDVLGTGGEKIDRSELGLAPRICLLCGRPAKECARSRAHTVKELSLRTDQLLLEAVDETDAADIAGLACKSLLYEVCTTPKPGLVDRVNSGSHKDMDIFTFLDSVCSLQPYFKVCARIGRQTAALPATETFPPLRRAGKKAEADMFSATRGVNTHKGAVFSVGILCAALGRLSRAQWTQPETVLRECAAIAHGIVDADFSGLTSQNACTAGQRLYLQYHITGIRGQAEAGFPAVRDVGLPVLREGLARGLTINDAGCAALLAIMTAATDTNLITRSSVATQQQITAALKALLQKTPYPDRTSLEKLDRAFIENNLSPGGSADLLAICYFLHFLESEA